MYLAIDYDGVNVYDQYENFYGNYLRRKEAIEALARAKREVAIDKYEDIW